MKLKLRHLFFGVMLTFAGANAQDYQQLTISSGYNADVIANGVGSSALSTSLPVDNANYVFMTNDFLPSTITTPPAYGLPLTGSISSLATTGLTYQLAPVTANNSLRFGATTGGLTTGTIAFSNGVAATKLYVLATSGSGVSTITSVITFADNTTQTITGTLVPDWFNSTTQPIAAWGFGRVNTTNNTVENPTNNPRMYELSLNISPENQAKVVSSVQFTKTSTTEGVVNIFAVTAQEAPACLSPYNVVATTGPSNASVSWTASVSAPSGGYDYYYSTTNTAPTATTTISGNVTATTVAFPTLATGQTYYFWVRSNCGSDSTSPWVPVTFTTGQVSSTYTVGDISTDYNGTPTVTSTTACPGTLSVTVPAGYQVASVATSYNMTTQSNGWMVEQRSLLVCTTTGLTEAAVTSGAGSTTGTYSYSRSGLSIANGATGTVNFELRAWRAYGGSGCNTSYNKVDNNTWTVTVTYCAAPATPTAAAQTFCNGATVANLVATGTGDAPVFNWYAAATGGTPLAATTALTSGTYYVSQAVSVCESNRVASVVTVTTTPAPTATAQTFCGAATVADLTATYADGATHAWYSTVTGTALEPTTALATGTYYVTQTLNSCTSTATAVTVTVTNTPAPTAVAQTFCGGATVNQLMATFADGSTHAWYATAGGTALENTAALATGTYYVTQTVSGCTSTATEVAVTVNNTPAPTADAIQIFCNGATAADLTATTGDGAIVAWYASLDAPAITNTTVLTSGTYYVVQTLNNCVSQPTAVTVTVTTTAVPAVNAQSFCDGAIVSDLTSETLTGATVHYYIDTTGDPLSDEAPLVSGTYYVAQSIEGCQSEPVAFEVTVNAIPDAPTGDAVQTFTTGQTIADLEASFVDGATVTWYVQNDGGDYVAVPVTTVLEDGVTYYVSQATSGCESEYLAVTANIVAGTGSITFNNLKVYPNPANEAITVANNDVISQVVITNLLGQTVLTQNANNNTVQVNLASLSAGTYILQVHAAGASANVKIVKQ